MTSIIRRPSNTGWAYFQQHQDKDYSLTDCISFLVMQQLDIRRAFAFDQHFVQAGFIREP
jgi:predicted nucleic acid-binding protein